jgi:hypothetical protein
MSTWATRRCSGWGWCRCRRRARRNRKLVRAAAAAGDDQMEGCPSPLLDRRRLREARRRRAFLGRCPFLALSWQRQTAARRDTERRSKIARFYERWRTMPQRPAHGRKGRLTFLFPPVNRRVAGSSPAAVIDNFSRRILAWRVAETFAPVNSVAVLVEASRTATQSETTPVVLAEFTALSTKRATGLCNPRRPGEADRSVARADRPRRMMRPFRLAGC